MVKSAADEKGPSSAASSEFSLTRSSKFSSAFSAKISPGSGEDKKLGVACEWEEGRKGGRVKRRESEEKGE